MSLPLCQTIGSWAINNARPTPCPLQWSLANCLKGCQQLQYCLHSHHVQVLAHRYVIFLCFLDVEIQSSQKPMQRSIQILSSWATNYATPPSRSHNYNIVLTLIRCKEVQILSQVSPQTQQSLLGFLRSESASAHFFARPTQP